MIEITIIGKQRALKRHRVAKNGRMYDPSYKDKKDIYLQIAKYRPRVTYAGNISIEIIAFRIIACVTGLGKFNGVVSAPPPMTHLFAFDLGAAL